MKRKNVLIVLFLLTLLYSGCTRKEDVVAYIGGRKITVSEISRRVKDLPDYYMGFIATEGGKRQYLSGMIKEEVLLLKSSDMKIDKRPEVAQRLKDMRREVLLASVIDYLQKEEIKVSDQEVKEYYEKHNADFANPEQVKVSHILLSDEKTAGEILNELKKGASFIKLAREFSIDTVTAINGGDLGYFGKGEMLQPEFEKEAFRLKKVGDISDIIKTPFGYHVAKLTGRRRGREKTFEESKDEIRLKLEKQKFNSVIEGYRREYNVRVNYDVLDELKIINDGEVKVNE